jgi:hypothetical protein
MFNLLKNLFSRKPPKDNIAGENSSMLAPVMTRSVLLNAARPNAAMIAKFNRDSNRKKNANQ